MTRLIVKQIPKRPLRHASAKKNQEANDTSKKKAETHVEEKKNKKNKKTEDMINEEQISAAEMQASNLGSVKVVKKDRGLIERTESSKIILTEDNRQVLND